MKVKHHTVIQINAEKAYDKTEHPFVVKTFNKVGIKGTFLNIMKANPQLTSYSKFFP